MRVENFELTTTDGLPLFVRSWCPGAENTKAVVQIAHGMAEHSARYAWLAATLNNAGYAVYANDHRGHGQTAVLQQQPHGYFASQQGWSKVVDDLATVTQHIKTAHPDMPIILLGHSMGSHVGQSYLIRYGQNLAAAMLSGTTGATGPMRYLGKLVALLEKVRVGPKGVSMLLDGSSYDAFNKPFKPQRTRFDWLSRDPQQVDLYVDDPWCGFSCSPSMWYDLLGGLGFNERDSNLANIDKNLPVYLITGEKDTSNGGLPGVEALAQRYIKAGLSDVTVKSYPDGRHEMFNETNREEVAADTISWFDQALVRAVK